MISATQARKVTSDSVANTTTDFIGERIQALLEIEAAIKVAGRYQQSQTLYKCRYPEIVAYISSAVQSNGFTVAVGQTPQDLIISW